MVLRRCGMCLGRRMRRGRTLLVAASILESAMPAKREGGRNAQGAERQSEHGDLRHTEAGQPASAARRIFPYPHRHNSLKTTPHQKRKSKDRNIRNSQSISGGHNSNSFADHRPARRPAARKLQVTVRLAAIRVVILLVERIQLLKNLRIFVERLQIANHG